MIIIQEKVCFLINTEFSELVVHQLQVLIQKMI